MAAPDHYPYEPRPAFLRSWILDRLHGPRVLDVGCGVGFLGHSRPDLRWTGIDISPVACQAAARHYERVVCGSAADTEQLGKLPGPFDEIVCCDILEHFEDPASVLRSLHGLLVPGGEVLVAIPNIAQWAVRKALLLGRWDYADEGPLDRTHLRFFTLESARELLSDSGFTVQECGHSIVVPRVLRLARPALARRPALFSTHFLAVARSGARLSAVSSENPLSSGSE